MSRAIEILGLYNLLSGQGHNWEKLVVISSIWPIIQVTLSPSILTLFPNKFQLCWRCNIDALAPIVIFVQVNEYANLEVSEAGGSTQKKRDKHKKTAKYQVAWRRIDHGQEGGRFLYAITPPPWDIALFSGGVQRR